MREHIQKVQDYRLGVTSVYKDMFIEPMNKDISKINVDTNLSAEGRLQKIAETKAKYERELYDFAQKSFEYQKAELEQAKTKANAILDKTTKAPDDLTVQRFKRSLADLKTDLLLSSSPKVSAEKVANFADSVNDPFLAELLREEYPGLISSIGGGLTGPEKTALGGAVDSVRSRFITPEQQEALDCLELAQSMESTRVISFAVTQHMSEHFGQQAADRMNNPEQLEKALATNEGEAV